MINISNDALNVPNNINNRKLDEYELLKKKYKKLENQNKELKAIIEEMIGLSENLKISFRNTEIMYVKINDLIKRDLSEKTYNSGITVNSENLLKSHKNGSQDDLINLNRGKSLNFFDSQSVPGIKKLPIISSNKNIDNKNSQININLNSNTNITNIYNIGIANEVNNSNMKVNSQNDEKIQHIIINNSKNDLNASNDSNIKESKYEIAVNNYEKDFNSYQIREKVDNCSPKKISSLRNSFEKDFIISLGEDMNNKKNFIMNDKEIEYSNIFDNNQSKEKENNNNNVEIGRKSSIQTKYKSLSDDIKLNEKEFSNYSNINNNNHEDKISSLKIEEKSNKEKITNDNNSIENSTKDNNNNTSNSSNQNKNELKEKIYATENDLEVEFDNISRIFSDKENKLNNNVDLVNKLNNNFNQIKKKFMQIRLQKEEYEKKNLNMLKTLKESGDNYNSVYAKYKDFNKFIDFLYKSNHSILVFNEVKDDIIHTIKCEPVPSYLRFINNIIN